MLKFGDCHCCGVFDMTVQLKPLPASQEATVFEHITTRWMQCPIGAFSRSIGTTRYLDKAVVEGQIVAKRVLPPLCVFAIIRKPIHYEFIDFVKCKHLFL